MKFNSSKRGLLFGMLSLSMLVPSLSQAVIVGTIGYEANTFPFTFGAGTRYQQVYDANLFSGPMLIENLTFYNSTSIDAATLSEGAFEIHLSATDAIVDGLSATFDDNVGSNDAFFANLAGGVTVASGNTLDIAGTAFNYNPADGNLLLDMFTNITSYGQGGFDGHTGDFGGASSRMQDFGSTSSSANSGYGLVTGFNEVSTVPIPATVWLFGSALLGLAGIGTRKAAS